LEGVAVIADLPEECFARETALQNSRGDEIARKAVLDENEKGLFGAKA
jgi:hypothetical protein